MLVGILLIFNIVSSETMIRGLTQVTWERVDLCFHESRLKYNAHYNIQVSFNYYSFLQIITLTTLALTFLV